MFDSVIGQVKLKKYLSTEIETNTLSHGYIIEGDRFMGKEFFALQVGQAITVNAYITKLVPSNDRKLLHVDDIREMIHDAYSQSYGDTKKVYILPRSDEMTPQAQNAFLKVLEEPPQDCVFFLLATDRFKLLSTIRSRCTALTLSRYSDADIREYLKSQNLDYNLETVMLCNGTLNKYLYLNTEEFKVVDALAYKVLANIRQLHSARVFAIFKHVKKIKDNVDDLLDLFLMWYRDMYVYLVTEDASLIASDLKRDKIVACSKDYDTPEILEIISQIEICRTKLKYNCNLEMSINVLLLYMNGGINTWDL